MITKNQIKHFASLQKKKSRDAERLFLVEGNRSVIELLGTKLPVATVLALPEWLAQHRQDLPKDIDVIECTADDMKKISTLQSPPPVIAAVPMIETGTLPVPSDQLILVLDTVQDPGNLGTIIRTADWFGICHVVCSNETVDLYNPKVVQSTMGALGRVTLHYCDLKRYISEMKAEGCPVYGTLLSGTDFYAEDLTSHGLIVLGNEGNGISAELEALVDKRLYIPPFPAGSDKVESLNVGVAASIVCAEFRRRAR